MLLVLITHGSVRRQNISLAHAFLSTWMAFVLFKASDLSRCWKPGHEVLVQTGVPGS